MDDLEILEQNYAAYFREERIFAKWRHKQVIEFILYREWEANNSQGKYNMNITYYADWYNFLSQFLQNSLKMDGKPPNFGSHSLTITGKEMV